MAVEARLKVVEGSLMQLSYDLPKDKPFRIGRYRRCDMPIMSRRVSKEHATITFRNGNYTIQDPGSKTGTFVNERKVASTVLRKNDLIQIAGVKLRFVVEDALEKAPFATQPSSKPVVIPPKPAPQPPTQEAEATPTEIEVPVFSTEELDRIGETIGGIKLIAALAKGRRTLIYKGIHPAKNRVVAFKMLTPEAVKDPAIVRWFVTGTQRAAEFTHEDAVTPLGGGREDGAVFAYSVFMEHGNARDRFVRTRRQGLLAVKRALESIVHVARALEFGQSKGIFHLGVRPTKILYNENRRAKLIGLGFDNTRNAPGARMTDAIAAYLSPEQVSGTAEITASSDIFSLGATFYYMLTGQTPVWDHRRRIPSPKRANRLVPDSICRIIEKMVVPIPARRYRTYGQLLHDVRWALRGEAWPHR